MKKLLTVALIAAAIFAVNSAIPNGGMNDPPDGRGIAWMPQGQIIAASPNGGMNDPPDSDGIAMKPTGGSNDPPIGTLI